MAALTDRNADTAYGYERVIRYRDGYFWCDLSIHFDRKRVKLKRPIRGLSQRRLMRRVIP